MRALPVLALLSLAGCGTEIAAATTGSPTDAAVLSSPGVDSSASADVGDTGTRRDSGDSGDDGGFCHGSGPIIPVPGANTKCTGDVGATTFLFAVCSCQDVSVSGDFITDSLPATAGGSPGNGGSIGTNGALTTNSTLKVNGSVWSEASGEATAVLAMQTSTIFGDVHAGAAVEADQSLTIADDLYVNGDANGAISCDVAYIPAGDTAANVTASGGIVSAPVVVPAPCDCDDILDIGTIVAAFANANDDAIAGLTPSSFASFPSSPVTLPCGQYYFDGLAGGAVSLTIGGRAAVFVNGDFTVQDSLDLSLAPGAELDLFISGNLVLSDATLGPSDSPARVRVYVGGTTFTLSGTATIGANIYAPNASVLLSTSLEMAGSLFVGSLVLSGAFTIHYDESILSTAGCAKGGGACTTCHDCSGATPACIGGACAACQTDSDCCPPLKCSQGACYDAVP